MLLAASLMEESQAPLRLRVWREMARMIWELEYSTAATGPRRPRHKAMSGSRASSHKHSGEKKRITVRLPRVAKPTAPPGSRVCPVA